MEIQINSKLEQSEDGGKEEQVKLNVNTKPHQCTQPECWQGFWTGSPLTQKVRMGPRADIEPAKV